MTASTDPGRGVGARLPRAAPRRAVTAHPMYPLHLAPTPEQALFEETGRKLLAAESPLSAVRALAGDPLGFDRALWRRQAALGWFGLLVPEASGGGSLSASGVVDLTIVAAELGRLVQPGPVLPTGIVAGAVARFPDAAHADALAGMIAGDVTAAWCAPDAEELWRGRAGIVVASQGHDFVLDGSATYVQDAQGADLFLVAGADGTGMSQFLVPASLPGVTVEPLECLDLARRLADVHFHGAVVPGASIVGEPGRARAEVDRQMALCVTLQNAESVGAADAMFEVTVAYAKERMAFGRPIGAYQAIKHRLADMLTLLESCKATTMAAASAMDSGAAAAPELVSVAKSFVGRAAPTLVQECVQIHGGIGVTWEHDIHLYLRRVATNAALYGTPAAHERRLADLLAG